MDPPLWHWLPIQQIVARWFRVDVGWLNRGFCFLGLGWIVMYWLAVMGVCFDWALTPVCVTIHLWAFPMLVNRFGMDSSRWCFSTVSLILSMFFLQEHDMENYEWKFQRKIKPHLLYLMGEMSCWSFSCWRHRPSHHRLFHIGWLNNSNWLNLDNFIQEHDMENYEDIFELNINWYMFYLIDEMNYWSLNGYWRHRPSHHRLFHIGWLNNSNWLNLDNFIQEHDMENYKKPIQLSFNGKFFKFIRWKRCFMTWVIVAGLFQSLKSSPGRLKSAEIELNTRMFYKSMIRKTRINI